MVSTKVGGIPEVLPSHFIKLCAPKPSDLIEKLCDAVVLVKNLDPMKLHDEVKYMYSWPDVAERTEKVYDRMSRQEPSTITDRFKKYYDCGPWAGKLFCFLVAWAFLVYYVFEWLYPKEVFDIAIDFPTEKYSKTKKKQLNKRV